MLFRKQSVFGYSVLPLSISDANTQIYYYETIYSSMSIKISCICSWKDVRMYTLIIDVIYCCRQVSGASMNPARTLGPAIVMHQYEGIWIYIVGPLVGAIMGGFSYNLIRFTDKPLHEITKSSTLLRSLTGQRSWVMVVWFVVRSLITWSLESHLNTRFNYKLWKYEVLNCHSVKVKGLKCLIVMNLSEPSCNVSLFIRNYIERVVMGNFNVIEKNFVDLVYMYETNRHVTLMIW